MPSRPPLFGSAFAPGRVRPRTLRAAAAALVLTVLFAAPAGAQQVDRTSPWAAPPEPYRSGVPHLVPLQAGAETAGRARDGVRPVAAGAARRASAPGPPSSAAGDDGPHPAVLALAGVGASGVGILGGFLIGGELALQGGSGGLDALSGGVVGAAIGTTVAVPLTVHLVNGRRGTWWLAQAASVGTLAAGLGLAALLDPEAGESDTGQRIVVISIPLGQVASSVALEKGTAGARR